MEQPKVLEELAPGVWHSEHDLFLLGAVHFRTRMTVLDTGDGLMLHGPVPLDEAQAERIAKLGDVKHIVAPNSFHHLYARPAADKFPAAKLWRGEALVTKRPNLQGEVIVAGSEPSFGETKSLVVGGMPKLDEVVVLHPGTRTLVVTDLVFNILEYKGWLSGVMFRLTGTHKKLAQSRLLRSAIKQRAAYEQSLQEILSWDFERVVMAHGEVMER
ncbi:MAG: DUF4336 domain-containing protein, partial [Myxococcales bacterium]|nr:DUF4336 domain-containing protein [Myxococcales bacterium]